MLWQKTGRLALAVTATLAMASAFAKTEYAPEDFYRHGSGDTPYVKIVGIEPGSYILAMDRKANPNREFADAF